MVFTRQAVLSLLLLLPLIACDARPENRDHDRDTTTARPDAVAQDAGLSDLLPSEGPASTDAGPPTDLAPPPDTTGPACLHHSSGKTDYAPVQTVGPKLPGGALLPPGVAASSWAKPTAAPGYSVPFSGAPGAKASHEGVDYVIGSGGPKDVPVLAAADGLVAYVRLGCAQSCMFCHNTATRECGAGWGNHVVLLHAGGIYTRYAHLAPGSIPAAVRVGQPVSQGQQLARMGNTGRSETRHLHLELGTRKVALDPCAASQSFDLVFDPAQLPW